MKRANSGRDGIVVPAIGPVLNAARTAQRLTLARVAQAAGISQSMLSQIERGQANPTFAILLSLVRVLEIDLKDIVGSSHKDEREVLIELLSATGAPHVRSHDGSCRLMILSPPGTIGEVEWYRLDFKARGTLDSEPHAPGTCEHLTMLRGRLRVRSGESVTEVDEGETLHYPADVQHEIENVSDEPVEALLFVLFAGRSAPMWERVRLDAD